MHCPLVSIEHVTVTLQKTIALWDINLNLYPGQHLALLGPNGAGKSTLLRLIRGEVYPNQKNGGHIRWFPLAQQGSDRSGLAESSPLVAREMAALISPAQQAMFIRQTWDMTGEEVIIAGMYDNFFLYHDPVEPQREAAHAIAQVLGAEALLSKALNTFSQGQLRLILLARALVRRPQLLLLDEAADGLDASACRALNHALENLVMQENAPTLIMSTHRTLPGFIQEYIRLEAGYASGPYAVPPAPPENMLLAEGEDDKTLDQTIPNTEGLHILVDNATVYIDHTPVLHELHWEIRPRQHWAVFGPNGSGKSTLLRLLLGMENAAVGGSVRRFLNGVPLKLLEELHKHVRLVSDRFQVLYTYDNTAWEVVFSGFDGKVGVYRSPTPEETAMVDTLLDITDMKPFAQQKFHTLSTGQARRIILARALAGAPRMLLLDEPFSGLDQESRASMLQLVTKLAHTRVQIILVSHYEEDIPPWIGHVAHMDGGRWLPPGPGPRLIP